MRERLKRAFDRFIDVRDKSDQATATLLREMEIDIAVDLKGFTQDARPGILAFRPAPVQVNYLGHPGTMGARYIDYLIADRRIVPKDTSAITARRSSSFPTAIRPTTASAASPSARRRARRRGCPIPASCSARSTAASRSRRKCSTSGCACSNPSKEACSGCSTTIPRPCAISSAKPRRAACSAQRLVFAPRRPLDEHLARHRLADLFLDTLPCNAHTTASDALWAGLPVLTCIGNTFAGRVAASLLSAVGLPELITDSLSSYEAMAMKLARDPTALAALKAKLAAQRNTAAAVRHRTLHAPSRICLRDDVGALAARDAGPRASRSRRHSHDCGGPYRSLASAPCRRARQGGASLPRRPSRRSHELRGAPSPRVPVRPAWPVGGCAESDGARDRAQSTCAGTRCSSEEARCRSSIVMTRPSPVSTARSGSTRASPKCASTGRHRSTACAATRRPADDYARLLDIAPDFPFARGNRLFCRLQCCDWRIAGRRDGRNHGRHASR